MIETLSGASVKLSRNDRDRELIAHVIYCSCMRLKEKEVLTYLKDKGHNIGAATYYRIKKEIEQTTRERLSLVASKEFLSQHIERIDNLKTIQSEMWANYHLEKNPTKRANMLMQIAELQQYLSSFYDSTQYVMQQAANIKKRKKELSEQQ
jgi:hypothetical protein